MYAYVQPCLGWWSLINDQHIFQGWNILKPATTWGALSARKKSDIQQNLLFEDPRWERLERLENLKYRNFWSFQVFSGSSHALAALSIT